MTPDSRLVLCMIVKNEAAILRRCLGAALPHVDGAVICDTGSTDDTPRIAAEAASAAGVPHLVARHDWVDFGHNRTLSAREARAWVAARGWPLALTYLLFLDADMIVHALAGFDRRALEAAAYEVRQEGGTMSHYRLRLARLSREWRSVGVTHEYWEPVGGAPRAERLRTLWIEDRDDGGGHPDKLDRDIHVLTEGLGQDPGNARYMFYLAQSLYDAGHFADAADWYARRFAQSGWTEERWYARYRQGMCLLRMGETERGAGTLLEAFEERPGRAEPLHALARHYRERGKNQLALMLAVRALKVPYPDDDVLFVEKGVYDWQLLDEIMVSAYYAGPSHSELGLDACERLLLRRGQDAGFYAYVGRNESFYVQPWPPIGRGTFKVSPALTMTAGAGAPGDAGAGIYACSNPGVVRWRDRTFVNVRLVNYRQHRGRVYEASDADAVVRTRNVTLDWDAEGGRALGERESTAALPVGWPMDTAVRGVEDLRWAVHEDRVWFTATCHQVPGAAGLPRMVLGRMNEALDAVEHLVDLRYDGARDVERNWVLWPRDGALQVIYTFDPLIVLRVDPRSGHAAPVAPPGPLRLGGRWRGSSPPIPIPERPGRWLAVVHENAHFSDDTIYAHRFVELEAHPGRPAAVTACTRPFLFDHRGVENAAGACDAGGGRLLVTYGWEDREARWSTLAWRDVLAALDKGPLAPGG